METTPEIISALVALAAGLEEWGLPGIIALLLLGPLMTVLAVFALDYLRRRTERQDAEDRRLEAKADRELTRELMEKHRTETAVLVERHREETTSILRDLGAKHAEVTQFYKDNVELVKTTQRMAGDMRDLILNNTRAMEKLSNAIEANFYCPIVRESATGKK
jgi:hypothetical protein